MKCANCGSDLKEGESFCGSCGSRVDMNFESNRGNVIDAQIENSNLSIKEDKFNNSQVNWHHIRIIGLVIMLATIWMPWVSYASVNFSSGTVESFSGSLWELCTSYLSIGNSLYMGIFGIVLSLVFTIMKKNILSIIFWLIGSVSFLLIMSMGNGNVHFKIGAYASMAGIFVVIVSIVMKRIESKAVKNNL